MKKSIIAGAAASAVLAAMPVLGVFAADTTEMVDSINITIADFCTFDADSHTYNKDMTANDKQTVGTTTMNVKCNNSTGYKVTAEFDGLDNDSGNERIEFKTAELTAGTAGWTAYLQNGGTETATYLNDTATVLHNDSITSAAGDTANIEYTVATGTTQAAGTYTGTATYTLAVNE